MKTETNLKRLYEYDNFREFLRDFYLHAKSKDKKFSFRYFARSAGLVSPSSLKRVIDGERSLTADGIAKFTKVLKLNKEESEFFEKLVSFNQSQKSEERQKLAREIMQCRGYKRMRPLSQAQFNCLCHWYFLPIRELVNLPDFKEDPQWIAKKLSPQIKASEASQALADLLKLGLLEKTPDGRIIQTSTDITTGDEVIFSAVGHYHRELLRMAGESIDRVSRENRDISAMTLGVSGKSAQKIKEMIQNFRKEVVEVLAREEQNPDCVYQLNLQLFPVAEPSGGESS